jgi:fucose permease
MSLSMLVFGYVSSWWAVIVLSITWGLCGGGIDIQLNSFAAKHFSSRHMSWLHGCWGIGAASGPLIFAGALAWSGSWRVGFLVLAALMASLALAFWLTRQHWPIEQAARSDMEGATAPLPPRADPPIAAIWLSPACFFFVVAAEFATAIWVPSIMTTQHKLSPEHASHWATLFFASMMVGRFALGAIGERIGNRTQVRWGIATAMVGACLFWLAGATVFGGFGLALMGLGSAPLFPSLMHETTRRFGGEAAPRMVARQMTGAYLAAALMPLVYAVIVEHIGVHAIIPTAFLLQGLLMVCVISLDRATPPIDG